MTTLSATVSSSCRLVIDSVDSAYLQKYSLGLGLLVSVLVLVSEHLKHRQA